MLEYLKNQISTLFTKIGNMFSKAYSYFFGARIIPTTENNTTAVASKPLSTHQTVVISAVSQQPVTILTKYIKPQYETALSKVLNNHVPPQNRLLNINAYLYSTIANKTLREIIDNMKTDLHIYRPQGAVTAPLLLQDAQISRTVKPLTWSNSLLVASGIKMRDETYFAKPKIHKLAPK